MRVFGAGALVVCVNFFTFFIFLNQNFVSLRAAGAKEDFLWGVSNSSFQVEGSPADSDWNRWVRLPYHTDDGSTADTATDFWNRYEEDFALAKNAGLNSFRISIAWERIEPEQNKWDENALAHYEKILLTMKKYGLEPLVTLHHFPFPIWVRDKKGVYANDFEKYFARYATRVVKRLSRYPARVQYWVTFNEPGAVASAGYGSGWWPPEIKEGPIGHLKALRKMAGAHIEAVRKIKKTSWGKKVKIGVAQAWPAMIPLDPKNPQDVEAADLATWHQSSFFIQMITTGSARFHSRFNLPEPEEFKNDFELPEGKTTLDFLGINYYYRAFVHPDFGGAAPFYRTSGGQCPLSEIGWEMCPEGIEFSLQSAAQFGVPILITENGLGDSLDKDRGQFLKDHIEVALKAAKKLPVPLLGYMHWSLTDNWEWGCGLRCRFGLVEVDYKTFKRKPRPSYFVFKDIIQSKAFRDLLLVTK